MKRRSTRQLALSQRRQQISELRLQGWTQQAIGERLGIAQTTVSSDLRLIRRQWQRSAVDDFEQLRIEELQRIERLEREAWAAWERSQKPAQSAVVAGDAKPTTRKTVKNQIGNPRYLQVVQGGIVSRRAILGLDAPRRLAPTDVEGRAITLTDLLGRIHSAAPAPAAPALIDRSNVFDLEAEFARRAPPQPEEGRGETPGRGEAGGETPGREDAERREEGGGGETPSQQAGVPRGEKPLAFADCNLSPVTCNLASPEP